MAYDATQMQDWQISEAAEQHMPSPRDWQERLGLQPDEVIPMGRLAKLDFLKIIERLKNRPDGKYIEVTAITPTPLGEGKSTTSLGLIEGLGKAWHECGGVPVRAGAPSEDAHIMHTMVVNHAGSETKYRVSNAP